MQTRSTPRPRARWLTAVIGAAALLPLVGAIAGIDPAAATTPALTTPTTPDPISSTPTTPPAPNLLGAATAARATWTPPTAITEEQKLTVGVAGEIDGQATAHIALLPDGAACPASPLYPRQVASGARVAVTAVAPTTPPTTPAPLGGVFSQTLTLTPKDSGTFHLCAWLVAFPSSNEASTVAALDQVVTVANRPATLAVDVPPTVRAGDYFTLKLTGTTAATGRRALIMAEPFRDQSCDAMRKAASKKRPLQSVVGLASGAFTKSVRLRFPSKTAGNFMFCVQIVESVDRSPEAASGRALTVTEGIKCVSTQTALSQRTTDLGVIRARRDAALKRLTSAKTRLAPARAKVSKQRKVSNRRIATARKALRKAKSAAGRKRASKRLARVKKTEAARIYRAGASLRNANAAVRLHERSYRQYRTGATLLSDTISRTKKDLKKYCANP